jgi:phosphoglycerate kinase
MKTILELKNKLDRKRVFIRVDFNVPMDNGRITDDTRIKAARQTINHALKHQATVVLASHLGRPGGRRNRKYSLEPIAEHLAKLIGEEVDFAHDCVGPEAKEKVANTKRRVILLENLRFHPEEEANDDAFSQQLASLCDVYINDAFGTAHRAHASTVGMVRYVPIRAAGFLMKNEVEHLSKVLKNPQRPLFSILGGAKVSDKLDVIKNFINTVDGLLIGGAMAYTFLKEHGKPVGRSLVEDTLRATCASFEKRARARKIVFELPIDHVVASSLTDASAAETMDIGDERIGDRMGVDIGPKSVTKFRDALVGAKTVVWNGPMGVFEVDAFSKGTFGVAEAVASIRGTTIVGGGDSVAAVERSGVAHKMTFISTGGGASLEFLGGQTLPGVAALQ